MVTGRWVERSLAPVLVRALREFPVVVVTGPRQSGKTSLLRHQLSGTHRYVSIELPDVRLAAIRDPRGFLAQYAPPVIFDEVQYAPELLPHIKERVDAARSKHGQWVLSGSQNLLLLERVTESLAGRAAILRLLPLTKRELAGAPQRPFPWEEGPRRQPDAGFSFLPLWASLLRGFFPEIALDAERSIGLWHSSYLQTYVERDVRSLRQIGDLTQFQIFCRALAARAAQLLNLSDLSGELGVALNTAKAWLAVLEATHQIVVLRPYFANLSKRLVKTPKVYFTDVGMLCHLVGLKDPEHAAAGPLAGAIFENAVVGEVYKSLLHRGEEPRLYFWRTATGTEVDLLIETPDALVPVEVKSTATPRPEHASSIHQMRRDLRRRAVHSGYVVHTGDITLPLGDGVRAIPFASL
jgi:hypothetical protein